MTVRAMNDAHVGLTFNKRLLSFELWNTSYSIFSLCGICFLIMQGSASPEYAARVGKF